MAASLPREALDAVQIENKCAKRSCRDSVAANALTARSTAPRTALRAQPRCHANFPAPVWLKPGAPAA